METDDEIKGKSYVHWKSWQEAYPGIVDQNYLDDLSLKKCEDMAFRWRDKIIIAKDGDRVVGFTSYGKYRGDDLENAGEVFAIYVLAEYYGCAVGYRLMKEAIAQLADDPVIVLRVLKENKRAIRFYECFGFHADGREETLQLGSSIKEMRMILER